MGGRSAGGNLLLVHFGIFTAIVHMTRPFACTVLPVQDISQLGLCIDHTWSSSVDPRCEVLEFCSGQKGLQSLSKTQSRRRFSRYWAFKEATIIEAVKWIVTAAFRDNWRIRHSNRIGTSRKINLRHHSMGSSG